MPILLPHQNIKTSIISVLHSKKNNFVDNQGKYYEKDISKAY